MQSQEMELQSVRKTKFEVPDILFILGWISCKL